jgi:hypothetical protein
MNCQNALTVGFGIAVGNFRARGDVETFRNFVGSEGTLDPGRPYDVGVFACAEWLL